MPISRAKKEAVVQEIVDALRTNPTVTFVHFHRVPAAAQVAIRKRLREAGVRLRVAKKRLILRALAEAGPEGEVPLLEGEVAIAYGGDDIAPAREVRNARDVLPEEAMWELVGAIFEQRYLSREEAQALALIPGRQELLAQLAFVLKSPVQRLAATLAAVAEARSS